MMDARRIRLVASYSIPATLRNGSGISYVFVTFVLGIFIAEPLLLFYESGVFPLAQIIDYLKSALSVILAAVSLKAAIGELGDLEAQGRLIEAGAWAMYLLEERPALLSAVFVLEMICVPVFVAAGAFNQLSGDLQHGAVRYQLLRVSRNELLVGRFLGMALFTVALVATVLLAVVLYLGLRFDLYAWGPLLSWGARGIVLLSVMSLPYVALCSLISANVKSPFASLILGGVIIPGVPAIALSAMSVWKPLGNLIYLLPWGFQHRLFHPEIAQVLLAIGGCIAYAAAYLAIGAWLFRRRDL
jgi:ABC-type transport system involved in multi-copper enzyme maturation permease subunit